MSIRVVIADDHPIFLSGLKQILDAMTGVLLEAAYPDVATLLNNAGMQQPDILLLGIGQQFHSGCEDLPLIRKAYPGMKILLLSYFDNVSYIDYALKNNCSGYLLRNCAPGILLHAIQSVYQGQLYLEKEHQTRLKQYHDLLRIKQTAKYAFSPREKEILRLIVAGYNNQEIAGKLCLGARTIENYRFNLSIKLEVKNAAALVAKVVELNLLCN